MSDPIEPLLHGTVDWLESDGEPWQQLSMVYGIDADWSVTESYGFLYAGQDVFAASVDLFEIEPHIKTYLQSKYTDGQQPPVRILLQLDRMSGQYQILFEDSDSERWALDSPSQLRDLQEQLRPEFD